MKLAGIGILLSAFVLAMGSGCAGLREGSGDSSWPWKEAPAVVTSWRRADYPAKLATAHANGKVTVRFTVDDFGRVLDAQVVKSFDPRANQAALDDIRQWTFRPALVAGRPAFSRLSVNVYFQGTTSAGPLPPAPPAAERPQSLSKSRPEPIYTPQPNYPSQFHADGSTRAVHLLLAVDSHGGVIDYRLLRNPQPEFAQEAAVAAQNWKFKPARQGSLAVASLFPITMVFFK